MWQFSPIHDAPGTEVDFWMKVGQSELVSGIFLVWVKGRSQYPLCWWPSEANHQRFRVRGPFRSLQSQCFGPTVLALVTMTNIHHRGPYLLFYHCLQWFSASYSLSSPWQHCSQNVNPWLSANFNESAWILFGSYSVFVFSLDFLFALMSHLTHSLFFPIPSSFRTDDKGLEKDTNAFFFNWCHCYLLLAGNSLLGHKQGLCSGLNTGQVKHSSKVRYQKLCSSGFKDRQIMYLSPAIL